ncbi:MAG TPA: M23 family metallopeptidase, partial [Candidatus Paceibacterota bacterium]|nr:M23 family metallopeptidase [Candidatus Paceibacterota bacterium]
MPIFKIKRIVVLIAVVMAGLVLLFLYRTEYRQPSESESATASASIMPTPSLELGVPVGDSIYDPARITKKPFGIYVSPGHSPVSPERFSGFHTGTDFETTTAEADIDVPVPAFCDGKLLAKEYASGYGGVAVQSCTLDGQEVTIIYGHLNLSSIKVTAGQSIKRGDFIGNLGKGYSSQTDGERKHLHLGIHKGSAVDITGYVSSDDLLSN